MTKGKHVEMIQNLISLAAEHIRDAGLLFPNVLEDFSAGKINYSKEPFGALYWATKEQIETVRRIEEAGRLKVWHIIKGIYQMSDGGLMELETYLLAFSERKKMPKKNGAFLVHAYTRSLNWGITDYGDILIHSNNGGLKRLV